MRLLFDGWALVYEPNSPAALHTLALLAAQPEEMEAWAALPGESFHALPAAIKIRSQALPHTQAARLRWEQRLLPGLAQELGAWLHLTSSGPALFGRSPALVSPAVFLPDAPGLTRPGDLFADEAGSSRGAAGRLRQALAQGGLSRRHCLFWPADLPAPGGEPRLERLPPAVHPAFLEAQPPGAGFDLPEGMYLLYHGAYQRSDLQRLLEAWSWGSAAFGEAVPLAVAGLDGPAKAYWEAALANAGLEKSVRLLPMLHLSELAVLYKGCRALFQPGPPAPWGDPARTALACGKAVVGLESPWMDALTGPAAFLVQPEKPAEAQKFGRAGLVASDKPGRGLGAAIISVVVEDSLVERLENAARQRAAGWNLAAFPQALREAYLAQVKQPPG